MGACVAPSTGKAGGASPSHSLCSLEIYHRGLRRQQSDVGARAAIQNADPSIPHPYARTGQARFSLFTGKAGWSLFFILTPRKPLNSIILEIIYRFPYTFVKNWIFPNQIDGK